MADAPFAEVPDVTLAMKRPLTDGEAAYAEVLLVVASAMIRARFVDIDARIEAGTLPEVLVRHVATRMVVAVLAQRDPATEPKAESLGTYAVTYYEASAQEELDLSDDLAGLLAPPARGGGRPRSIGLGLGICPP